MTTPAQINLAAAYWIVGDHVSSGAFSSASGSYVPLTDPGYLAFVALFGVALPIDTEANLIAMLAQRVPSVVVATKAGLTAYANVAQWALATGGYTAKIPSGGTVAFATDIASMSLISGKAIRLLQPGAPASTQWQTGPAQFVTIATADFIAAATATEDFVQSTFDNLKTVLAGISAGTITTKVQVDATLAGG